MIAGAAGVVVATTRYGIGLTPDSVTYLSGARSLADGDGYTDLAGDAIGLFPPGYSAVLSIGERLGIDAVDAARGLSVITLVLTIALAYALLRHHVRSPGLQLGATALVGCSAVLLEIYSKALSEHLFVPVLLAFALVCEELVRHPRRPWLLTAAVVLAWAAFYLRYAGIVMLAVGALVLLAAEWRAGWVSAVLRSFLWGIAAASAPVVWMLRNDDAVGHPVGSRAEAASSTTENVKRVVNELSQWLATQLLPGVARGVILAAAAIALAVVVVAVARRRDPLPDDWKAMLPLAGLVVVYVGYLIASASIVAFAAINTRFMLPVFVPIVVLSAWLFERIRDRIPSATQRRVLTAVAAAWLAVNLAWFAGRAINSAQDGAGGYASERWQESALMQDVDDLDLATPTFTNDPRAIEIFLDKLVEQSPQRTRFQSGQGTNDLRRFVREVECGGPAQLVWFLPNGRKHLYDPKELREHVRLKVAVKRSDGVIYDVLPTSPPSTNCG